MHALTLFLLLLGRNPKEAFQILTPILSGTFASGVPAITLDTTCTGNGTANFIACSNMTVTAGDAISCNVTGVQGGGHVSGIMLDPVNGFYDADFGVVHPANANAWVITGVFANAAAGTYAPVLFYTNTPGTEATISCHAWKGAATSAILDGGSVAQAQTATSTNPNSGTAAAPTNNNQVVVAYMSRNSATAPTAGTGFTLSPSSLVGTTNIRQISEYEIQGTATARNGAFTTAVSAAYADSQLSILQNGQTNGYRSLSGWFLPLGAPSSAPTGTVTALLLNGATSTLASTQFNTTWALTQTGSPNPAYDTTVNPTGTRKILVQNVAHTFGDAGSSILFGGGATTSFFTIKDLFSGVGTPIWLNAFFRLDSTGATNSTVCDVFSQAGGVTDQQMIMQLQYASAGNYKVVLEPSESGSSATNATNLTAGTDYWFQLHVAGVNERYHQFLIYTKSGATWSLSQTLNYDHLCTNGVHTLCTTPAAVVTPNGTVSNGSTSLTVSSATSIALGQLVLDNNTNCIPWPTLVEGISGTTITLSQAATCALSSAATAFYTVPANLSVATNGTVSAGSKTLTVVAPGTGTIVANQVVGGSGIAPGTIVSSVAGTTVTLNIPAGAAMTNGGVSFWNADTNGGQVEFGKNAGGSCNVTSNMWGSGVMEDTFGLWGAFAPN